jgi:FixJ family two-component response regulator
MSARKVVYVVDDDPYVRTSVDRLLSTCGFDTELFDSGEDFLARAHSSGAICVVLDIQLPGMSGIELGERIARSGSGLPVIFITGSPDSATQNAARDVGGVAYLAKPCPLDALLAAIEAASNRNKPKN